MTDRFDYSNLPGTDLPGTDLPATDLPGRDLPDAEPVPTTRIQPGNAIPAIQLPQLDGSPFDSRELAGRRYLLSFYRFASCPFCNLRVHQLVMDSEHWPESFTAVAIFDSPLDNLQKHAGRHQAPFPILADASNRYYRRFGVEHSWWRTLKGGLLGLPRVLYAMVVKGYWPTSFKGRIDTMPLDILVDEKGVAQMVYYGRDEGDHLPLEQVQAFAQGARVEGAKTLE